MRHPFALAALLLVVVGTAWAASEVLIEDWTRQALGENGVPKGWTAPSWGKADYKGFSISANGSRALALVSRSESATIARDIKGMVHLKQTPILQWSWKVVVLPKGADSRRAATDDQAGQIYVVWKRFPEMVRSRIIGYVWDTTAPAGEFIKSQKTGTVTYVIVRSGPADLGRWFTEQRNVVDDYRRIYGEAPDNPDAIAVAIDSDDTRSTAETFMGPILFRAP